MLLKSVDGLPANSALVLAIMAAMTASPAIAKPQSPGRTTATAGQAPESTTSVRTAAETGTPDIIVTANKRSESVQKIAASITAISSAELQNRGLNSIQGLAAQVPSLQFSEQNSSLLLAIRGISLDVTTGSGEPAVAMHVDGIYIPRVTAPLIDLTDVSRIEVLRGPQGTLYGRNSTAGTINFISAEPTNTVEGGATIGAGSFDGRVVRGYISGPIVSDILLARISASYNQNDGQMTNLLNGDRLGGSKKAYVHGSVSYRPSNDFRADIGLFYVHDAFRPAPQQLVGEIPGFFSTYNPGQTILRTFEPDKIYSDLGSDGARDMLIASARLSYDISQNITLKSITGYTRHNFKAYLDADGTGASLASVGTPDDPQTNRSRSFSEELNASAKLGNLEAILGLFYYREDLQTRLPVYFQGGLLGGSVPPGSIAVQQASDKTKSYAAFADLTYHLTNRLRVVAGVRFTRDTKDYVQTQGLLIPGVPRSVTFACDDTPFTSKSSSVTPKFGVQYDIAPRVMLYAQYQQGIKAGLFNISVCGNKVKPEKITSYEMGIKSRIIGNSLTVNLSGFHYDYTDLDVTRVAVLDNVPTVILDNAATAKIDGVELEMAARASQRVSADLSIAYLNARYGRYDDGTTDFSGHKLNRAPDWNAKAGAEYRLPMSGFLSKLTVRGELQLTSEEFFQPSNTDDVRQPSNVIANGYATLSADSHGLTLRAFGRNLTNEHVASQIFGAAPQGSTFAIFAAPRTWGLELSKTF